MDIIFTENTWETYFWARYNGRKDVWFSSAALEKLKEGEWYLVEKVTQGRSWTKYFVKGMSKEEGINSVCFEPIETYFTEGFSNGFVPKKGDYLKNFRRRKPTDSEWELIEITSKVEDVTKIGDSYRVITRNSCYMI